MSSLTAAASAAKSRISQTLSALHPYSNATNDEAIEPTPLTQPPAGSIYSKIDLHNSPAVPAAKHPLSVAWNYDANGVGMPVATPTKPAGEAPALFKPLTIRNLQLKNRIMVSPMCQYSSTDGFFNNWHLVNAGSYAQSGVAAMMLEATAVTWEGRISVYDTGLWKDEQIPKLREIADFLHSQDCAAGIQLAHSGRKGSDVTLYHNRSSRGKTQNFATAEEGGWHDMVVGPSAKAWDAEDPKREEHPWIVPHELTVEEIKFLTAKFREAAIRSAKAGLDFVEVHSAHGYLLSSFLSPTSNRRTDQYGGSLQNRARFLLEVVAAVREVWDKALFVRVSCNEYAPDGSESWRIADTVELAKMLHAAGIDMLDCSSGGNYQAQNIGKVEEGYQIQYAEAVKKAVPDLLVGGVGLIVTSKFSNSVVEEGKADVVLIGRQLIREPRWPLRMASELGWDIKWAPQHSIAKPRGGKLFSIP